MMTPRAGFGSGSGSSSNLGMGSVRGESSVRKTTHGKSDQKRAKKRWDTYSNYALLIVKAFE
jgi:hypothetical protein